MLARVFTTSELLKNLIGRVELTGRRLDAAREEAKASLARYERTGITAHLRDALALKCAEEAAQCAFDAATSALEFNRERGETDDAMLYRAIGKSGPPRYRVVIQMDGEDFYWDGGLLAGNPEHAPTFELADAYVQGAKAVLAYWDDESVVEEARYELA